MLATVQSGVLVGVECVPVRVEVNVSPGLPAISVVGLAQSAVREGRERVRAAIQNEGFRIPPRRITVNLAPADLKKQGSGFDLPFALGLLAGSDHISAEALDGSAFVGELGLNGRLRPIRGVMAVAVACRRAGVQRLFVPDRNAAEAAAGATELEVFGAKTLGDVVSHLRGGSPLPATRVDIDETLAAPVARTEDLTDVRGHPGVKRALEVAAGGGHNLLLVGPPGSGKTMLARRLPGILPPLTPEEAVEVTTIYSVSGLLPPDEALVRRRPFRAPHHTVSAAGLAGGGASPRPGEVSLAHHGILFLDELPEFSRRVLETLRQPLEDGWISIVRARNRVRFPARFTLVAAMNPCPCGYLGDDRRPCECDPTLVARYRSRISGPLRDRIDMQVEVSGMSFREFDGADRGESSGAVRERVQEARHRQTVRHSGVAEDRTAPTPWNAMLKPARVRRWCRLDRKGRRLLEEVGDRSGLSPRGIHRVLKVARTIADLAGRSRIAESDLAEALQYRSIERRRY